MKVAVVVVKVVESPVHEVVDVAPVRDGGVTAARVVFRRAFHGRAGSGVAPVDFEDVLRHARGPGRMEVPVVEIIGVIAMTNGPVTAVRPVLVRVVLPILHGASSSSSGSIVPFAFRGQAVPEGA